MKLGADLPEAIGCDVGGTAVKVVRLRGDRVEARREVATGRRLRATPFVRALAAAIREVGAEDAARASRSARRGAGRERNASRDRALPVGIALPGFLDAERRRIVRLSNLPLLDGVALADRLERALGTGVILDADTNAGGVAEAVLGAARGKERVLYLTLGTGVGAALVVGGAPVRASHHTVGQVAHVPLSDRGPRCACGRFGCAESLLSARGIAQRAGLGPRGSPLALHEAAEAGNREAVAQWEETGDLLGALVRILAGMWSPDIVVVGGGIAAASAHFLPAARRRLRGEARRESGRIPVEAARLGRDAGATGAAILAARAT